MRIELSEDEVWSVFSVLTQSVLDGSALSDEDRAKLRRWRAEEMRPGREGLRNLTEKINTDLARALKTKERSAIQKHDWV